MNRNRIVPIIVFMLLVSVAIAHAIPPPPDLPTDTPPSDQSYLYNVTIIAPAPGATVNSTTVITYNDNSPSPVDCTLLINGTSPITATQLVSSRSETVALTNGTHWLNVTCANATVKFASTVVTFVVVNQTVVSAAPPASGGSIGITIVYPLVNDTPDANVTYLQNMTGSNCSITVDSWSSLRPRFGIHANELYTELFTPFSVGTHTFTVNCTNGALSGNATRVVTLSNSTYIYYAGLTVSPSKVYPGMNVSISGNFTPATTVGVGVVTPSTAVVTWNASADYYGMINTQYPVPLDARLGTYIVSAIDSYNVMKNGTFTVASRNPYILIVGNKTNVSDRTAFAVSGFQFVGTDNTTLTLSGGGNTVKNYTKTDSAGAFLFLYGGLAAGSYSLVARSSDGSVVSPTLSFLVIGTTPVVNTTPTPTPTTPPDTPIIGLEDPTETPTQQTGQEEQPVNTNPEPPVVAPTVTPQPTTPPDTQSPSSTGLPWWIFLVVFLVLVGGLVGYFVYNGTLDVSSVDGFKESVQNIISGNVSGNAGGNVGHAKGPGIGGFPNQGAPIDDADAQTIKSFIFGERGKGFDDLTIRGALIEKGWDKSEVDRVFDEMYKNG